MYIFICFLGQLFIPLKIFNSDKLLEYVQNGGGGGGGSSR